MSQPSKWPLPPESSRFVVPRKIIDKLAAHPLCEDLYPTGFGYYKQANSHTMLRRKHDDFLIIYCLGGRGVLSTEAKTLSIKTGDLIILPKDVAHEYRAAKNSPWTIYWVHFSGHKASDFIDYIATDSENSIIHLGVHARLVTDIESLLESGHTSYNLAAFVHASNLTRQILTQIAQLQPLAKQQANETFNLERIHSLMQASIHEQLDLDTLADSVSLSKFHFIKKYKDLTGTTPINHFIHLKIEKACYLLDATSQPIGDISYAVGYEDAYYFSRIFKKIMGISPSHYRRSRTGSMADMN